MTIKVQLNSLYSKILELVKDKYSLSEIAKILKVPYPSLYKFSRERGIKLQKNGTSRSTQKKISERVKWKFSKKKLYKWYFVELKNIYQIAEEQGCGHVTIFNLMKKFGFELRDKSESMKMVWTDEKREEQRKLANDGIIGVHLATKKGFRGNTSIEKSFIKWCQKNQVKFKQQQKIIPSGHQYDFLLIGTKILVETDGMYWHNKPEQKEKDKLQELQAIENGYLVCRFSDKEIQKTKGECFDRLLSIIN